MEYVALVQYSAPLSFNDEVLSLCCATSLGLCNARLYLQGMTQFEFECAGDDEQRLRPPILQHPLFPSHV
jgi:hypothetical protein